LGVHWPSLGDSSPNKRARSKNCRDGVSPNNAAASAVDTNPISSPLDLQAFGNPAAPSLSIHGGRCETPQSAPPSVVHVARCRTTKLRGDAGHPVRPTPGELMSNYTDLLRRRSRFESRRSRLSCNIFFLLSAQMSVSLWVDRLLPVGAPIRRARARSVSAAPLQSLYVLSF
jgi:hypothetical protein